MCTQTERVRRATATLVTAYPSLWLAVVPVILYDRPTPPPSVGGEGLSKPSPEPLLHVTASGITAVLPW